MSRQNRGVVGTFLIAVMGYVAWMVVGAPVPAIVASGPAQTKRVPTEPSRRVADTFVVRPYLAPKAAILHGEVGRLLVPVLGISAPVVATRLDRGVFAVPNDVSRVGWLRGTAERTSVIGSSVIAGHVSDGSDRPGALWRLREARVGQSVVWRGPTGVERRFVVVKVTRYPRITGLPASVFTTMGPHTLTLVTCANRRVQSDGRFHYEDNLVVTARAVI